MPAVGKHYCPSSIIGYMDSDVAKSGLSGLWSVISPFSARTKVVAHLGKAIPGHSLVLRSTSIATRTTFVFDQ